MNRTDRLYAMVELLRAAGSRGRTAAALAARFEVSERTIKRDVQALVAAGVRVRSQDGRGGGYQLERSASLPPLTFSGGEATAIAVALASEPQLPFRAEGRTALAKVLRALSPPAREEASRIAGRIWMRVPTAPARPGCARVIDEALARRLVVVIDYEDGKAQRTEGRRIEPLALARTHGHWHVLAWCRHRRAGRWFRLDRIRRARLTREPIVERSLHALFGEPPADAQPVRLDD